MDIRLKTQNPSRKKATVSHCSFGEIFSYPAYENISKLLRLKMWKHDNMSRTKNIKEINLLLLQSFSCLSFYIFCYELFLTMCL